MKEKLRGDVLYERLLLKKKKKKFTWHFVLRHSNLQEGTEVTVCRICIKNVSLRKGEAVNKIFLLLLTTKVSL